MLSEPFFPAWCRHPRDLMRLTAPSIAAAWLLSVGAGAARSQERPIELDTVHVTVASIASAQMASATRAVQVITAADIRQLPVTTVPEVLQWAMGVDLMPRSPALVDVGVRGSSFEQVLVMVDGVRVSDAQTGHFDLDLALPLEQVERVEILRGPASTLHGADAVGGVINIVTRRGVGSAVRLEAGTFGTTGGALAHGVRAGDTRLDLSIDARRSDGHRPGTDYEMGQGRAALATPFAGQTLDASFAWARRGFGANGFYGSNPGWNEYERTRAVTGVVALRPRGEARLAVEPVLSFRRHDDDFVLQRDDPSFYQNQHTTDQLGGRVTARYALAPAVRLAAGGEAYHDRLRSSSLGDRGESRGGVLGEVAVGRVGGLAGVLGARVDWHEAHGAFVSPALSGAWWATPVVRLRASVGRALRTPTWTERYYRDPANEGNSDLSPERSWSGEVGLDATPAAGVRLGVAVFQREADDLIDWARPAGGEAVWVTRNVESARFRGLEAQAAAVDPLGTRWTAQGSWLSVAASTPEGIESKYALRPLAESVVLGIDRPHPRGLTVSLRGVRARRVGEDAYLRADARVALQAGQLRLTFDVQNLADEEYLDIAGTPAAGRAAQVGVEWRRSGD